MTSYQRMTGVRAASFRGRMSLRVVVSYVFDWVLFAIFAAIAYVLGNISPNKRPFSLVDPNIAFPFTEHETVPDWLLFVLCAVVPAVFIAIVALIFVPGTTVPKNTPQSLIWKRKLWELHVGWLGLVMSVVTAWFFISGMKNLFGKPRPDLLDRCQPDLENAAKYVVGGIPKFSGPSHIGLLYSHDICTQTDKAKLDEGFRSYPSGHSAASAAGLTYLSLFLASKFAVTIPFVVPSLDNVGPTMHAAFPSRLDSRSNMGMSSVMRMKGANGHAAAHNSHILALRRQAAAPPVYLFIITVVPFGVAIFVASSRWFNFRHHGFDILFGFLMGLITAIFSFRFYHLPIRAGAGWAWGPRTRHRAFWAGVGRLGYVEDDSESAPLSHAYDVAETADIEAHPAGSGHQRNASVEPDQYQDVELQRLEDERVV